MDERQARTKSASPTWLGMLQLLGYRSYAPRPRHAHADTTAQEECKKTLPEAGARIQSEHPDVGVEAWSEDEHCIGLKPILRRIWCKKGCRPTVTVQHRYEWTYLYGFVCPKDGQTCWLLLLRVTTDVWTVVLAEFAAAIGAGRNKRIMLVLDQAGWHTSDKVVVPDGIDIVFLPPYSPELQPAERLWSLTNEGVVNTHFADMNALLDAQAERCRRLANQPDIIRAHTLFHW